MQQVRAPRALLVLGTLWPSEWSLHDPQTPRGWVGENQSPLTSAGGECEGRPLGALSPSEKGPSTIQKDARGGPQICSDQFTLSTGLATCVQRPLKVHAHPCYSSKLHGLGDPQARGVSAHSSEHGHPRYFFQGPQTGWGSACECTLTPRGALFQVPQTGWGCEWECTL